MSAPTVVYSNNNGASSNKKSYQQLLDANPYRNIHYTKSPWQNFLSALGFRTQADAWQENMNIQAREYDAAILQKQYDEEYNDPMSQVARERAAGLNPDINGGQNIDPGSAAPLGEDPSTPMQTTGDEPMIMNTVNTVLSSFSSALGIFQSFQGITRNRLQNTMMATDVESGFTDFADKWAFRFLPQKPDALIDEETGAATSWQLQALQSAQLFARRSLPKKMRNKFVDEVQSFWNGAPGTKEAYTKWYEGQEARFKFGVNRAAFGDLTFDDILFGMAAPFGKLLQDELKSGMEANIAENNANIAEDSNRAAYNESLGEHGAPQLQAESDLQAIKANKEANKVTERLRGAMNETLSFLRDASSGRGVGAGLAKIAYALLAMQALNLLPDMPGFSVNSSQKEGKSASSFGFSIR